MSHISVSTLSIVLPVMAAGALLACYLTEGAGKWSFFILGVALTFIGMLASAAAQAFKEYERRITRLEEKLNRLARDTSEPTL